MPEGDFIQLLPDSSFASRPLTSLDTAFTGRKKSQQVQGCPVTVAIRTPNGSIMRITGELGPGYVSGLIGAASRV